MSSSPPLRSQPRLRPDAATFDPGIVRVAALRGITSVLRDRGVKPADVLASLGLAPGLLDRAENRIHYRMAGQLLQRCADITSCTHFGLLVGRQANILSLGLLGELVQVTPTVRSALRTLLLYMPMQMRGGVVTHDVEGKSATLGYAVYQHDMAGTAQAYDLVVAYEFNILRALCGPRWLPGEVSFSHAAPKDTRPYSQFFRAPLRFNSDRSQIAFNKTWLDHPLSTRDAAAHILLQRELAKRLLLAPNDWAERIRQALRTMILSGHGSAAAISDLLSISTREMRRLLAAQGTNFRDLLEEVRFEFARQLLADSEMTTTEIAGVLDYGDASAFTRAFRRWTNSPPAAWRANMGSAVSQRGMSSFRRKDR